MTQKTSWLYSLTLFLSAWLLFAVQPLLGKLMLPLVGGSPNGWLTALAFFQLALLVGYLLAHCLSKLSARHQALATILLLIVGGIFLPPNFTIRPEQQITSEWDVLQLLCRTIAVPYLGLAMVSSGLQRLFAARQAAASPAPQDTYSLYAVSNAGSFMGLLSYPLVVEPFMPLSSQQWVWSVGYAVLIGLMFLAAAPKLAAALPQTTANQPRTDHAPPLSWRQRLLWVMLAFIPSSLSMGLTSLLTMDLGALPLLWVLPLALYLLTFVIAFAKKRRVQAEHLAATHLVLVAAMLFVFAFENGNSIAAGVKFVSSLIAFGITALWCHIRLADARPDTTRLTEYYLWLAVGGALGGSLNAFIAPLLFSVPIEFLLTLLMSCLLHQASPKMLDKIITVFGVIITCVTVAYFIGLRPETQLETILMIKIIILPFGLLLAFRYVHSVPLTGILVIMLVLSPLSINHPLARDRDFFGAIKIFTVPQKNGSVWRYFGHGSTVHGMQQVQPTINTKVNSYYTPLIAATELLKPKDIGVMGLGAGVLLCLPGNGYQFTVYEIAPLVVTIAKEWFTFIKDCGEPRWRIGDARLELARDNAANYDLLVMDAFSSDSVPTHLLTQEALAIYLSRLRPNGVLAFNISNRFYNLQYPLAALAKDAGLQIWTMRDTVTDLDQGRVPSNWIMMARPEVNLASLKSVGWQPLVTTDYPVWRDDLTNQLTALKLLTPQANHADVREGK